MITKAEIDQKAIEFKINSSDVQRDYIFGWVLQGLYSESLLGESMILKGGNALRKGYYADTRFSKDLDFSVQKEINPDRVREKLKELSRLVGEKTGVEFRTDDIKVEKSNKFVDRNAVEKEVYEAKLYFKSFYGEERVVIKIQLDITSFDEIILPIQTLNLIHPYPDSDKCVGNIKVHKLEEILASKMHTLLQRRKVSDLFDLAYSTIINNKYDISRLEMLRVLLRKSLSEANPENAKQALYAVPLEEFRSDWGSIIAPSTTLFGFDQVISGFKNTIDNLFSTLSPAPIPHLAYSGVNSSDFAERFQNLDTRNSIISSGKSRNLVELVYDGVRRLVEPYALEYRVRKSDGQSLEYFWGYDTSGGRSGHIGIKMFIYNKIENAQPTESSLTQDLK